MSTGYEQISEVIYHFVNTFLYMNVERYGSLKGEMDKLETSFGPEYIVPENISGSKTMLDRMVCILNSKLSQNLGGSKTKENSQLCYCGKSNVCDKEKDFYTPFSDAKLRYLTYTRRTANNKFLYPGDAYCANEYNFMDDGVRVFGF